MLINATQLFHMCGNKKNSLNYLLDILWRFAHPAKGIDILKQTVIFRHCAWKSSSELKSLYGASTRIF